MLIKFEMTFLAPYLFSEHLKSTSEKHNFFVHFDEMKCSLTAVACIGF